MAIVHARRTVTPEGRDGGTVPRKPNLVAARNGVEVRRAGDIELRAGDRIRRTRNDAHPGPVDGRTAEAASVGRDRVAFRLDDGRRIELGRGGPQLRHPDHARASTAHAFRGRTVDDVIAAMEASHLHLTTASGSSDKTTRLRSRHDGTRAAVSSCWRRALPMASVA